MATVFDHSKTTVLKEPPRLRAPIPKRHSSVIVRYESELQSLEVHLRFLELNKNSIDHYTQMAIVQNRHLRTRKTKTEVPLRRPMPVRYDPTQKKWSMECFSNKSGDIVRVPLHTGPKLQAISDHIALTALTTKQKKRTVLPAI